MQLRSIPREFQLAVAYKSISGITAKQWIEVVSHKLTDYESFKEAFKSMWWKMRLKTDKRKKRKKGGTFKWQPQLEERVLVKCQPVSDASQGSTSKFIRVYEGPFCISKVINPNIYEVSDEKGKLRGMFNLRHMKPYLDSANVKLD
jgi:hypothetical protein